MAMFMTRSAKWFFANIMIASALLAYGKVSFQEPIDRPALGKFAVQYGNVDSSSPWQRLQKARYSCVENMIYRNVPRRKDGDAVVFEETCYGDRVLALADQGGTLSPLQQNVAKAARDYREQLKYFYMAGFFYVMCTIPIFYNRIMRFWARFGKPIMRFLRYCQDVIKKMSS